jgi:hypothetical protein
MRGNMPAEYTRILCDSERRCCSSSAAANGLRQIFP